MRISDWSSDVCSSDLPSGLHNIEGHLDFARCERVLGSKQAQKPRRIVPIALVRGARLLRFAVGAPAALLIKIVETDPIPPRSRVECALDQGKPPDARDADRHPRRQRDDPPLILPHQPGSPSSGARTGPELMTTVASET